MRGDREHSEHAGWLMIGLRYVLPAVVTLGGAIVMLFGTEIDLEGGAGIVSAGLAIYAANWLYRASVEGDIVRVEEEEARTYLDEHGHWPDEAPKHPPRHPPVKPAVAADRTLPSQARSKTLPGHERRPGGAAGKRARRQPGSRSDSAGG